MKTLFVLDYTTGEAHVFTLPKKKMSEEKIEEFMEKKCEEGILSSTSNLNWMVTNISELKIH